ncbi:MAG: hypothetical protein KDC38_04325, partial [Planctomycetes bacterium]|nr:hypothetical protein [Planctomycetota bacterium]
SAFILAIGHEWDELTLENIDVSSTDTATANPEFISSDIQLSGGILTVIFDFESPFDGHSLAPGLGRVLARYFYSAVVVPIDPEPATTHVIDFVDGTLGFPPVNNLLNIGGAQVFPVTNPGTVTCLPYIAPNGALYCGRFNPTSSQVENISERVGSVCSFSFYYSEPEDQIQGFEFAIEHDPRLIVQSTCIDPSGSQLELLGAEFYNCVVDDDPQGGTHFALGVLMDAFPPFTGQVLPPTDVPLLLGSIDLLIDPTTTPGAELHADFTPWSTVDVMFVVNDMIQPVPTLVGGTVTALPPLNILRGDCNNDAVVDLADSIIVLNVIFFGGEMLGCEIACDHNGDGTFDVADYIYLTNYVFLDGPPLPAPFPTCGPVPGAECAIPPSCP